MRQHGRVRTNALAERWPLPGREELRDALLSAYARPERTYHDLRHLAEVLDRLDELADAGTAFDREVVLLAAWFHDAVHDGGADDEERSARWAEETLDGHPATPETARLVRMTQHHRPDDADAEGCALSDADLAILAAPRERYAEYAATVRREYAHLPDDVFTAGRLEVLRELAAKPHLFHTAHARQHWEARARANLAEEIRTLSAGGAAAPPP